MKKQSERNQVSLETNMFIKFPEIQPVVYEIQPVVFISSQNKFK